MFLVFTKFYERMKIMNERSFVVKRVEYAVPLSKLCSSLLDGAMESSLGRADPRPWRRMVRRGT